MSNELIKNYKRSHGRRIGDSYEKLLLAYWCLRMTIEREILWVRHEVRELEPADDIIVEYDTRIECYQAKHSANPHSLIFLSELTEPAKEGKLPLLGRLSKVWEGLWSGEKSVELHIYTNRAAGPDLGSILDGDQIEEKVLNRKKKKTLYKQLVEAVSVSSAEYISDFLQSLRFDLRKPNVDELENEIKKVWLKERLGLEPENAYKLLLQHTNRWFLGSESRPIKREEVLEALQVDQTSLLQNFPVNWNTLVSRPNFERRVINALNETKQGYMALVGPPGSGKSTFITQLIQNIRQKRIRIIRYYCFTSGSDVNYSSRLNRNEFLKSLIEQLLRECGDLLSERGKRYDYSPIRLANLLTYVGKTLKGRGEYLVFIVDGIDHLIRNNPHASEDILKIFPRELPDGVICLFGCQGLQYLPAFIRRECESERTFSLPLFTRSQTRYYLSRYPNNPSPLRLVDVLGPIHSKCKGLPLYLRYMAERLGMSNCRTPKQLVDQFPEYDGHIKLYYATLWDEFGDDSIIKQLCGLVAQLRFSVKKVDLIEMADVDGSFEGARLLSRIEHLLLIETDEYSLFHESFRIFVLEELHPEMKNDLDSRILRYLKGRIYSEAWFQHAHEYAEKCKDNRYLTENFGWAYVEKAISKGRDPEEIVKVLQTAVVAAIRERDFVTVAELSLLAAHTNNRLDYHLDRTDLLRAMAVLGDSKTVIGGITSGGKDLKLTSQNARLLIWIADCGGLERWRSIADNFIDRLDLSEVDPDLSDAATELVAIYRPQAIDVLVNLIQTLLVDTRSLRLRTVLRRLNDKGEFGTIRALKRWLQSLEEWTELSKVWYFWIAKNEYRVRRNTCIHHIIKAGRATRDPSQNVLLSEMVWELNGDRQLAASLLEGLKLNKKGIVSLNDLVGGLDFGAIRAYVRMLMRLGREQEVEVLEEYTNTEATIQALYVRTNIKIISAPEADGDAFRDALIQLVSEQKESVKDSLDVRMAIQHDLPELLHYVFSKFNSSGGNVRRLADELRDKYIGSSIQISNSVLLKALIRVNCANGELKSLLEYEYKIIIDNTLETQTRTSELLELTELAAKSGYRGLARKWLQKAIGASRGYGYRKDTTLRQLVGALEIVIKRGISDSPSRIAQIADWNLLVAKFTDGKSTKWFPHALYDVVLNFNRDLALQLLVAYKENLPAWQFHYALERFIATWEEGAAEIAYLCTELISEHTWEDPYASKFEARISLLESVANIDPGNADWTTEQIRNFILTEVPPDIRGPFIERFNMVAEKSKLHQIEDASVYTRADVETSGFTSDSTFVIGDKEVTRGELPEHLSQSVEVFARCIRSLEAENGIFRCREEISDAIVRLIRKARGKPEVRELYEIVKTNEDIESTSRLMIAQALLDRGDISRAKSLCENVFHDDNKYDIWNPNVESIEFLARLDPEYAIEALLSFAEQRIQEHVWIGYGTFLVFIRALDRLGDEYTETLHELYLSYSHFIEYQFESLETDAPSPYQWIRKKTQSRAEFENTALKFVAKEWETPVLHRRESLMNLIHKVALRQPRLMIPWLISLLENYNHSVSEQAAVVLHSIALRQPKLLGDHCYELMSQVENSHFTQVTHIIGCLENLETATEVEELIQQTLRRTRPIIGKDPVVISDNSLQPSPMFRERAWKRTMDTIQEAVKNAAITLDMKLNEIQWRIERAMYDIGYDEECSNEEWWSRRDKFSNRGLSDTWIPFESYDSHFVWHALNAVVEKRVRESSVDVKPMTCTMGLYDPVLPIVPASQKPEDLSVPYVDKPHLSTVPNSVKTWLKFQDEPAITRTILEKDWVNIFDDYKLNAGCASEVCTTCSFLASEALCDAILNERYSPEPYTGVLQIGHEPPYFMITRLAAKELLNEGYGEIDIVPTHLVPLIAAHHGWNLQLWKYTLTSLAGRWIRQYDLKWGNAESLDLCGNGRTVQRFVEWRDGAEAKMYSYRPAGRGTRLSVRTDFLETIMATYKLRLITVSDRLRQLSSPRNLSSELTRKEEKVTVRVA